MSKFGVQVAPGVGGILQPKFKYRFRVKFYGFGIDADTTKLEQNVETVGRPKFNQPEAAIHSYNSQVYLGGKPNWDAIEVVVRDDITNGSLSAIGQQIQKQFNFFEQTSAISGSDYKFRMEIESLDGTHGSAIELWNLEGCWLTSVTNDGGDYKEATGHQIITLSVRFDNATCIAGNNENVATVGGDPFPSEVAVVGGNLGNAIGGFFG